MLTAHLKHVGIQAVSGTPQLKSITKQNIPY
jgi:hypothetical protein